MVSVSDHASAPFLYSTLTDRTVAVALLVAALLVLAWFYDRAFLSPQRKAHHDMAGNSIDMDAILAQREEATGSADTFSFTFKGKEWHCKDPITADDEFKDALYDLETDLEVSEAYLGEEQYAEFVAAGGRAGYVILAINRYMQKMRQDQNNDGRPTRRLNSSAKRRKR